MTRIVQVANFVTPSSGGLRTALGHLASGYADAGHDVMQIIPGRGDSETAMPWGTLLTLRAPALPGTGYRVHARPRTVLRALTRLRPGRLEVHDRTTLRGLGGWASAHGVPALVISHERLDRLLGQWRRTGAGPGPRRSAGSRSSRRQRLALAWRGVQRPTGAGA